MVAAANPYATRAGLDILRAGGSAVDAAIAVQMVLTLVEPQSSGIGGGAFLLTFDAARGAVQAYDGRETAPAAATPAMFLGPDGVPVIRDEAVVSGRSVGVPGVLRMLELAHKAHGRLPWSALFEPAIALAEGGFVISPRLNRYVAADKYLATYEVPRAYFYNARGKPRRAGETLVNRPLADVLRIIARDGADAFYRGPIADDLVAATRATTHSPGLLTAADLEGYSPVERPALCAPYRGYRVCGMPPPTAGGVTLLELLGILAHFDLGALEPGSAAAAHLLVEASRLADADRRAYVADPSFAAVPVAQLLAPEYLARRAALIDPMRGMGKAAPGVLDPPQSRLAPDDALELESTSHIAIVDADGNAVSMTTSLAAVFGSRLMVHGFMLNNHLTDFSLTPERDGAPVQNRVEPGKRPRSSMAPTLVLDGTGRKLRMAVGSPGGGRIIGYVAATLVGVLDWGLDMQQAIDMQHIVNRRGKTEVERSRGNSDAARALRRRLRAMGHKVVVRGLESGLQGIVVTPVGYEGGADPRREGVVLGD